MNEMMRKSSHFPTQLMCILDDGSYNHIITWLPEGNGFTILDKKEFERVVLPQWFNEKNKLTVCYSSFTRRMNRWNFALCNVTNKCARYFHPEFIRGNYKLLSRMKPKPQKQWRKTKEGKWMTIETSDSSVCAVNAVNVTRESIETQIDINLASYRSQVKEKEQNLLGLNLEVGVPTSVPIPASSQDIPHQDLNQYSYNNAPYYSNLYSYPTTTPTTSSMYVPPSIYPQKKKKMMMMNHCYPSYIGARSSFCTLDGPVNRSVTKMHIPYYTPSYSIARSSYGVHHPADELRKIKSQYAAWY